MNINGIEIKKWGDCPIEPEKHPHLWRERDKNAPFVYFMLAFDIGSSLGLNFARFVKIGTADNPRKRLEQLQTGCPLTLKIWQVTRGGQELEQKIHKALEEYRTHGEWFRMTPEVKELIQEAPEDDWRYSW